MSPQAPTSTGASLGRYRLLGKLAAGGMAEVFLAEVAGPAGFQKTVVVKRIHPHLSSDPHFVEMFLHEARLAALLDHPNIVQIFELGEADGTFFIAMEHVDGANLRTLAERSLELEAPVPYAHAARIVALACEGLGFAHDFAKDGRPLDLVHRDISPDNLMLSRAGAVKVMDFGVAKASNQRHHTKTGTLKGKLAYMPPEQLNGEPLDRRADLFALGVTLYELLAGCSPFDASSEVAVLESILHHPPVPLRERRPDCPEPLVEILDRALQKRREDRYPDCQSMQRDLEAFLRSEPLVGARELAELVRTLAPPESPSAGLPTPVFAPTPLLPTLPERGRRTQARREGLFAGLAVGVLGVSALAAIVLAPEADAPVLQAQVVVPGSDAAALEPPDAAVVAGPDAASPPAATARPATRSNPKAGTPPPKMVEIPIPSDPPPTDTGASERDFPAAAARFRAADVNGDRKLSREEFREFRTLDFDTYDQDGDGQVSAAEYARARLASRRQR